MTVNKVLWAVGLVTTWLAANLLGAAQPHLPGPLATYVQVMAWAMTFATIGWPIYGIWRVYEKECDASHTR